MDRKEIDMWEILVRGMGGEDPSDIIPQQEAKGQQDFVNSTTLPKNIRNGSKEQLEEMGIVFGEDVDDLFVEVQLPEGWKREATDHDMWNKLVNKKGEEQAMIFYKAAFYDRDAFISITSNTCQ